MAFEPLQQLSCCKELTAARQPRLEEPWCYKQDMEHPKTEVQEVPYHSWRAIPSRPSRMGLGKQAATLPWPQVMPQQAKEAL